MTTKTLLWLDDIRNPHKNDWLNFAPVPDYNEVVWVKSYNEFTDWITKNGLPYAICFDHDLGLPSYLDMVSSGTSKRMARKLNVVENNGYDCAKWLVEYCMDNGNLDLPAYNIHSQNPVGKENIKGILVGYDNFNNLHKANQSISESWMKIQSKMYQAKQNKL